MGQVDIVRNLLRRTLAALAAVGLSAALLCPSASDSLAAAPDGGPIVVRLNPAPKPPSGPISKTPPDPTPPTKAKAKYLFDLKYDKGDPYLVSIRKLELHAPEEAPRVMGRFALELFEGPTLIERVRFDFPMLAVQEADAGYTSPPRFEPKLTTRVGVFFPALSKGTRLELWDRATDRRWELPWPIPASAVDTPAAKGPGDAGPDGRAATAADAGTRT